MSLAPSLRTVKGICILDNDGKRIFSKYYDKDDQSFATVKDQKLFESKMFKDTEKSTSEIVAINNYTVVFRSNVDLFFYVLGDSRENELMLLSVLNTLYDSISLILRKNVEKRALYDQMDSILLICDEVVDQGIMLECDASSIVSRVHVKTEDIPLSEQTVTQAWNTAKEQLKWTLLG